MTLGDIFNKVYLLCVKCDYEQTIDRPCTQLQVDGNHRKPFCSAASDIETATSFQDSRSTEIEKSLKQVNRRIDDVNQKMKEVGTGTKDPEIDRLKESVLDMQSRSMRDNLVFVGLEEGKDEDCSRVLERFLHEQLHIEKTVECDRVHRMGAQRDDRQRPRPMVAKFTYYKDKDLVRKAGFENLKGTKFYINEQFPKEIEDRRRRLYPVRRAAYQAGDKATLSVDKLYINGRLYVPGEPVPSSKCALLTRKHTVEDIKSHRGERRVASNSMESS